MMTNTVSLLISRMISGGRKALRRYSKKFDVSELPLSPVKRLVSIRLLSLIIFRTAAGEDRNRSIRKIKTLKRKFRKCLVCGFGANFSQTMSSQSIRNFIS